MALVAIFTLSFTIKGQDNTRGRSDRRSAPQTENRWTAKNRAEAMGKELELTAEQVAKVQALFEKQDAERTKEVAAQRSRRDQSVGDRDARRKAMDASREKTMAENDKALEKIIGKEKLEQWKKIREERQKALRDANRQGRRNAPPARR